MKTFAAFEGIWYMFICFFRMLVYCQFKKGTGLYTLFWLFNPPQTSHFTKLAPREKYGIFTWTKNDICATGHGQLGGLEGFIAAGLEQWNAMS